MTFPRAFSSREGFFKTKVKPSKLSGLEISYEWIKSTSRLVRILAVE
jgi:hypothetical protein